jgi:DNA-binding CsgD family transcriptional regulator
VEHVEPSILLSEDDARALVRLVADIAILNAPVQVKKHRLMTSLSELLDSDAWGWILSRAEKSNNNPSVVEFLHGGMTEEQVGAYAAMMQDRHSPQVEYSALNNLRLTEQHFTRTWDQLVTEEQWYGDTNHLLHEVGFEQVIYSVRVLDQDGLFSGISLKRHSGRPRFTPRERRMLHIVSSEVDWLHACSDSLSSASYGVRALTPRQRAVLTLMLEGQPLKQIAYILGITPNTVCGYAKQIHKHFTVSSRGELIRRFMAGDGRDIC